MITYNGERQPQKKEKALKRSCLIITTVGLLSRSYDSRQLTHKELNILGKMKANGSGHKWSVQWYLLKSSCSSIFREFQWTQYKQAAFLSLSSCHRYSSWNTKVLYQSSIQSSESLFVLLWNDASVTPMFPKATPFTVLLNFTPELILKVGSSTWQTFSFFLFILFC